ncbi:hypothetical protein ANCDUO_05074 [Ancylostoma duodenale]|uniref:Uncharacterized protein n=1 Tax=Ancylostoma duodenale TaxID=51022 RepID=A0A0C2H5C4_9BILA|nr:hypothetical protein ANCDUO_05074 [Ancylostoma duodenale]
MIIREKDIQGTQDSSNLSGMLTRGPKINRNVFAAALPTTSCNVQPSEHQKHVATRPGDGDPAGNALIVITNPAIAMSLGLAQNATEIILCIMHR